MDIKADIEKQIHAGFTREEIFMNLESKGVSKQDFDQQYDTISSSPEIRQRYGSVSPGSIMIGILFLLVMVWRLGRYQNSGNVFLLVGGVSALILAILFFTKKK